jgi:microcystin degradation protein MlrC
LAFICDAAVVDELATCPPGTRRQVVLGRNCDRRFAAPFATEVVVQDHVDGKFRLEGLYFNGLEQDMGGAVVLKAAQTYILAGRRPVFCSEPNLYRCAGLEPADYEIVSIKSPRSFRPNFAPITEAVLYLDMGGVASPNLASMPWQKVRRPLFPLDRQAECRLDVWAGRAS